MAQPGRRSFNESGSIKFSPESTGPPEIQAHEIVYQEKIGGGCFGHVYTGKCRGNQVAVKKLFRQDLNEKTLTNFKKEVEICSRVHHPNVVLFMGACTKPGEMAIVSELMTGNVQSLIHDPKVHLSMYRKMQMAKDVALGMNWLHCSNPSIVHRDLKPANLLYDSHGTIKVCDFGLSALIQPDAKLQDKGVIPGTPLWMSPEVLLGQPLDEKADVYSFGIVLWEIVNEKEPFPEFASFPEFKRAICKYVVRPPIEKDLPESIARLMKLCWDKTPSLRPAFGDIIPRLSSIIVDCACADETGRAMWKEHFREKEKVEWGQFCAAVAATLRLSAPAFDDDLQWKCLKTILAKKDLESSLKTPPEVVSLLEFGKILDWFGPMDENLLYRIENTLRQGFFHGAISKEEAESRLYKQNKGKFLIRLSTTNSGQFTISKVTKNEKINHQRIDYKPNRGFMVKITTTSGATKLLTAQGTLAEFVSRASSLLHLHSPCPGSPYSSMFEKKPPSVEGYLADVNNFEEVGDFDD
eukprot:TRINITY_DN212_c0_g1_i1.p1 TRINITY_DN212_c0_g1~~TRINITY_DN212_c0_g1_i1.p1  ORF type:complete len:524 (+),score=140.72 TRINITY_DN212_c0_g1_i1:197-1768(+)